MLRIQDGPIRNQWFSVKFIDTLQLLNSSFSTLASNLIRSGQNYSLLKHSMQMKLQYPTLNAISIAGKGTFPYSYISSWEKLEEKQLPPLKLFTMN